MSDLREAVARAMQSARRQAILDRINAGECSASMSGLEYYPPWEDETDASKGEVLKDADAAIAIVLERVLSGLERLYDDIAGRLDGPMCRGEFTVDYLRALAEDTMS